jgi:NurA domain
MARWRSALAARWRPLPGLAPNARREPSYGRTIHVAVDGTSHAVQLSNGAHFILAAAAAMGPVPVGQRERADMEILPARFDDGAAFSARDYLMRALETYLAVEAAGIVAAEGIAEQSILWVDGSLYGDLSHIASAPHQMSWGGSLERLGSLLRQTAALHDQAERSGLWVVGVGKTQRASFLYHALAAGAGAGPDDVSDRPSDGEILASAPTGWSWPLILDSRHFPNVTAEAQEILEHCPAIVSFYVRPHPADLPLRVDVPASAVGLGDRLLPELLDEAATPWPAWVPDPDAVQPVVEAVLASYGGLRAYNAPLYAVDRLVRLPRRDLELRYLPMCAKVAGLPPGALSVDRGRRRFLLQ